MIKSLITILSILSLAQGFSATMPRRHATSSKITAAPLFVGRTPSLSDFSSPLDEQFQVFLFEAQACAMSADTTSSEANSYLSILTELLSGCENGAITGDMCENNEDVVETVAHLRAKVNAQSDAITSVSMTPVALVPMFLLLLVSTIFFTTVDFHNGAIPFTFEEWTWAAQGNYLDEMITHYIKNGGL